MCIGHNDKLRRLEYVDRSLEYAIVRGWANPKELPKIQAYWPIIGEPVIKPKKLTKRQAEKMKQFNSYIMSGKWRKK